MHNEYHYKWPVLPVTINTAYPIVVTTSSTETFRALTRDTVMAPSIQVFVQVALLCCVVTTSMGGVTDRQKAFSQVENKVNVQQEEIKLLHQMNSWRRDWNHLKRKVSLKKYKIQIQLAVPNLHTC